ncbi:MAG TPA: hypothetical protein PLD88_15560, partial [Candidatus Berkiella sp.]|nr:hypothetical protein [Candidatus Berkiella sp.]
KLATILHCLHVNVKLFIKRKSDSESRSLFKNQIAQRLVAITDLSVIAWGVSVGYAGFGPYFSLGF